MIYKYIGIALLAFTILNTIVVLIAHIQNDIEYAKGTTGYMVTMVFLSILYSLSFYLIS